MFNPSRDQVRSFFIETWRKHRAKEVLTPMETIAADIITHHPEYHAVIEDPEAIDRDFPPESGQINPFLHLSLHLAIEEQLSIDQPPGIRAAFEAACARRGERHDAMHDALECLGETLFNAQRNGGAPDGAAYVSALRKRAGLAL
ncbi:MAG TPA: DUF1841 domain-containing protein [Thauera sp.]|nr:DUF1841 domain-containing protein [Thauera sp.]HHW63035.1 DUF1841 family protein [Rhodocyclaceae bacterium]